MGRAGNKKYSGFLPLEQLTYQARPFGIDCAAAPAREASEPCRPARRGPRVRRNQVHHESRVLRGAQYYTYHSWMPLAKGPRCVSFFYHR